MNENTVVACHILNIFLIRTCYIFHIHMLRSSLPSQVGLCLGTRICAKEWTF